MTLQIKEGFELRKVGDDYVIITVGDAVNIFNGMIKLNSSGVFVWEQLKNGVDLDTIIDQVASKYLIDKMVATNDVNTFIENLKQTNCFVE